jgi:hypothetical protein
MFITQIERFDLSADSMVKAILPLSAEQAGVELVLGRARQLLRVRAVGRNRVDVEVAVAVRLEGDPRPVSRPGRVGVDAAREVISRWPDASGAIT